MCLPAVARTRVCVSVDIPPNLILLFYFYFCLGLFAVGLWVSASFWHYKSGFSDRVVVTSVNQPLQGNCLCRMFLFSILGRFAEGRGSEELRADAKQLIHNAKDMMR
ncbi:hypothetical protein BRADI_1g12875v3 [Brachypodium distachyon]|uniref:Uncharacterized protein n=1 Tax=Brachypodium distachyon TaxID=15368 RepID=A0A0Q3RLR5_BRADI|nr:hypothetical protein BRADI_1g12875v3 [Brachypodium distachyon]